MPDTLETVVAFDFGLRRIGIAVGQQVTGSANPLGIAANGEAGPDWVTISKIVGDWRPARLIVGLPSHSDGSPSDVGRQAGLFADALCRYQLPVDTIDERYSSIEAEEMLKRERALGIRGRIKKEMIDSAAAVLIAERWLQKNSEPAIR